jgi:hypothetical protein
MTPRNASITAASLAMISFRRGLRVNLPLGVTTHDRRVVRSRQLTRARGRGPARPLRLLTASRRYVTGSRPAMVFVACAGSTPGQARAADSGSKLRTPRVVRLRAPRLKSGTEAPSVTALFREPKGSRFHPCRRRTCTSPRCASSLLRRARLARSRGLCGRARRPLANGGYRRGAAGRTSPRVFCR